ncbi:MAG TPA: SDR family oxidoreductase [Devosia sp.]|nr:SDR family oxidoreductase [Devosia sp.]
MTDKDWGRRLTGKIAVVTAAGQGIGRAIADRLVAEGAEVHASDLNIGLLTAFGGASATGLDVTDQAAVNAFFERFARIDVLVHAAGYVHQGTIEECTPADWRRTMSVTLDSAYHVFGAAVPRMKQKGGSIVAIVSVASGIKGFARRAAYGAAKAGVHGLVKSVAIDYLRHGLRCNAVNPGTVDSPSLQGRVDELARQLGSREAAMKVFIDRQPAGRLGRPEEIAGICAFLASDDAGFITGQFINVDGGITI